VIHLDTHVVMWLRGDPGRRLPKGVRRRIDQSADVRVSPMVALELDYMVEVGRATASASVVLAELQQSIGLTMSAAPFALVVRHAQPLTWTRDPFDRLIVATALADGADLVTADRRICEHVPTAVWD